MRCRYNKIFGNSYSKSFLLEPTPQPSSRPSVDPVLEALAGVPVPGFRTGVVGFAYPASQSVFTRHRAPPRLASSTLNDILPEVVCEQIEHAMTTSFGKVWRNRSQFVPEKLPVNYIMFLSAVTLGLILCATLFVVGLILSILPLTFTSLIAIILLAVASCLYILPRITPFIGPSVLVTDAALDLVQPLIDRILAQGAMAGRVALSRDSLAYKGGVCARNAPAVFIRVETVDVHGGWTLGAAVGAADEFQRTLPDLPEVIGTLRTPTNEELYECSLYIATVEDMARSVKAPLSTE